MYFRLCPVQECVHHISERDLMCAEHWSMVSSLLQDKLIEAHRYGTTMAFTVVVNAAVRQVNRKVSRKFAETLDSKPPSA